MHHPARIRREQSADAAGIRAVNEAAFDGPGEARLVDALRDDGGLSLSLVGLVDETIVGHIAFSPVRVGDVETPLSPLALAPMAVHPDWQRRGVGSALVRAGLDEARGLGYGVVIVLGHSEYYPRFGFVPASAFGISCPYPAPDEAFLIAELQPGAAGGFKGLVKYRPEFDSL